MLFHFFSMQHIRVFEKKTELGSVTRNSVISQFQLIRFFNFQLSVSIGYLEISYQSVSVF